MEKSVQKGGGVGAYKRMRVRGGEKGKEATEMLLPW